MVHLSFILLTIPRGVFLLLTVGSVFLKIIKITLLVILALIGLLLLLLILVLAAPIRYRIRGGWRGELLLKGKITWLYKILGVRVQMVEKKPEIKISIFGYTLGSKKKCCKKRKKKAGEEAADTVQTSAAAELDEALGEDIFQEHPGLEEICDPENTETTAEPVSTDSGGHGEGSQPDSTEESDGEPIFSAMGVDDASDWEESSISPEDELLFEEALDLAGADAETGKTGLAGRIKAFFSRIRSAVGSLFHRIRSLLPFGKEKEELSETALAEQGELPDEIDADTVAKDGAFARVKGIIVKVREFLAIPSVKKLIGKLWKSIRKILKHLMPSDLQIDARVGMGDPAKTGQIMELAAVLYAFYGDHIRIESSFDEEVKEGQAELTGRIVPGYLLLKAAEMGIRIILNKECRRLYKEIRA